MFAILNAGMGSLKTLNGNWKAQSVMEETFTCPNCGEDVARDALACPACGADEETGWSSRTAYDDLWLPDEGVVEPKGTPLSGYILAFVGLFMVAAMLASVTPWALLLLPVILVIVAVAYVQREIWPRTARAREQGLYAALLRRARGDEALVARLIDFEAQRMPGADRVALLDAALARWRRDSR
jgi:hypothetical protein